MQNNVHILSDEEYNDLLIQKNEPDALLRDTNLELKQKVEDLTKQLKNGSFERINVDSPIMINDGTLHTTSVADFIQMYNTLSNHGNCTTIKSADTSVFEYLVQMAEMFACNSFFVDVSALKKYRVSLQTKGLYSNTKKNGLIFMVKAGD